MGFWNWVEYSNYGARRNGKKDGAKSIPTKDQSDHAPYEKALAKIANENIRRTAAGWERLDADLKGKYCDAKREYHDACTAHNKEGGEAGLAETILNTALAKKHDSSEYPHMGAWAYRILIIFIALGEMPLTATVFDILGENRLLTYIFAAVLCVALPTTAHFLGIIIREKFNRKNGILLIVNLIVFIGVLVAIAYMREKFFEASDLQKVLSVKMDPAMVTLVFIAIQLFIFAVATTAAYFAHDPHPELKRSLKKYQHAKKSWEKEKGEALQAVNRLKQAATVFAKISAAREKTFKSYNDRAREIKEIQERTIETYRTYNLRARSDLPVEAFKSYPAIEIPESLQTLDVDCGVLEDMTKRSLEEK